MPTQDLRKREERARRTIDEVILREELEKIERRVKYLQDAEKQSRVQFPGAT